MSFERSSTTARAGEVLRFGRFAVVGLMNTAVDYGLWALLFYLLHAPLLLAQAASYAAGIANSYVMNSSWTFGASTLADPARIGKFAAVNAVSYAAGLGAIALFALLVPPWAAKVLTVIATVLLNYLGSRLWVFRVSGSPQRRGAGSAAERR